MIELSLEEEKQYKFGASIRVIGIGGAGGNAVNSMINHADLHAVDFIVANTDAQALQLSPATSKIQLGGKITKGLGAGSNPDLGRRAAEEDLDTVIEYVMNTDILFLTAGLGGGTGTGALPVIASAAKELGILTVVVVTKPFSFEGKRRFKYAEDAIHQLRGAVDTLIVVPNQRLLEIADPKISMFNAFSMSNDILMQAIKGISDIITKPGHINVDFADVKAIMKDMGMALMGTGRASGSDRARQATLKAISSPLLENVSIEGARGVLINITGNANLGLQEINEAATLIYDLVSEDANIILGSVVDQEFGDELMVTVIATGFEISAYPQQPQKSYATSAVLRHETVGVPHKQHERHETVVAKQATVKPAHAAVEKPFKESVKVKEEALEEDLELNQQEETAETFEAAEEELSAAQDDYSVGSDDLDTPTFLRKKVESEKASH